MKRARRTPPRFTVVRSEGPRPRVLAPRDSWPLAPESLDAREETIAMTLADLLWADLQKRPPGKR